MKTLSIDVNIAKWVVEILLQGGKKQSNDCVLSTFFEVVCKTNSENL